jgi:hypothetical protein
VLVRETGKPNAQVARNLRINAVDPRLMWIQDTEHLRTVAPSSALAREGADREDLLVVERGCEMRFDPDGC